MGLKSAVLITTFNRPACLARSLPQIVAAAKEVGAPVLVVDDGSDYAWEEPCAYYENKGSADYNNAQYLHLPQNRGLAGALNIGLSWFLADPSIEAIHYVQDDIEADPLAFVAIQALMEECQKIHPWAAYTVHDAKEHRERGASELRCTRIGMIASERTSCRGTHIFASRGAWERVMPVRSRGVGLPSKVIRDSNRPAERGTGSGADWWLCRDAPHHMKPVICLPNLLRSFAHKRQDSTWDNGSIGGEEPPLSRDAIREWVEARKS